MAKPLNDILKGVNKSKMLSGRLGKNPGVDYEPKAKDEADFAGKHVIQRHDDRTGNGDDIFQATNVKHALMKPEEKRHGYKKPQDERVNEAKGSEDAQCNSTPSGKHCPMHGMNECMTVKKINEDEHYKADLPNMHKDLKAKKLNTSDMRRKYGMSWKKLMHHTNQEHDTATRDNAIAMAKKHMNEEVDQVDEVSQDTLSRYRRAAKSERMDPEKGAQRKAGMGLALKKILGTDAVGNKPKVKATNEEALGDHAGFKTGDKVSYETSKNNKNNKGTVHSVKGDTVTVKGSNYLGGDVMHDVHHSMVKKMNEEALGDHAGLAKYADKHGRIDKEDLHTAAKHMKSGNMGALKKHLHAMDTDPRDKALEHVHKKHYAKLGYSNEEVEQVDEISSSTLVSYSQKAHQQVKGNQPSDPDKLRKRTNREKGIKLAFNKHYQFRTKVPATTNEKAEHDDKPPFAGPYDKKEDQKAKDKNVAKNAARKFMKQMTKEDIELDEVLTKSTTAGETIHDFVHSKNPKFDGKSKEKRKEMALAAYYAKQRNEEAGDSNGNFNQTPPVREDLAMPLLGGDSKPRGDSSEAVSMVKAELKALANKAMHLVTQMPDNMHVEPWVQAKIAQSKSMVSDVHDYCIYGDHENEEIPDNTGASGGSAGGAMVMNQMDTPLTFPNMSIDVNTGVNV